MMDEDRFRAFLVGLGCVIVLVLNEPLTGRWVLNVLAPLLVALGGSWGGYRAHKWLNGKGWL